MSRMKKILAVMLAIMMMVTVCSPVNVSGSLLQKAESVIDSELRAILANSEKDDQIPVDIWLYDTVSTTQLEQEISSRIGMTKAQIINSSERTLSTEKVDEYIMTERALYAEKNNQQYEEILKDYSNVKALSEKRSGKRLFFSQYAPLISAELTSAEIKLLAQDSRVQAIYYSPDIELVPESNNSVSVIRANYTRDNLGYTGSGVKIGMIEAKGLPNKNDSYFTSENIIYDPNVTKTYRLHANDVAAIMVAKATTVNGVTYQGIVPDAKLYATYYESGDYSDWRARVEWLLSQGVNVINMSAGFKQAAAGTYGIHECWLDHIAINHSVHFVKSAGNESGKISSPGMAYNILTVGSIDDKNTISYADDIRASYSNYIELYGTNKPELMAPGHNITTAAETNSGTSFAAPHVTAVVAQLCQRRPALKLLQDGMKAILTASISHSKHVYDTSDTAYDEFGAGVVDARSAFYTSDNNRFTTNSFSANSTAGSTKNYTFNVSSSDSKIRVSLTWLKYSELTGAHSGTTITGYMLADLNLYVYDPDGNLVASSTETSCNTEIVDFKPNKTGTYKIVVKQQSDVNRTVYFGLAWW